METTSFIQNVNILVDKITDILQINEKFTQEDLKVLSKYDYSTFQGIIEDLSKEQSSIKEVAKVVTELIAIYESLDAITSAKVDVTALKEEIQALYTSIKEYLTEQSALLKEQVDQTVVLFDKYIDRVTHETKLSNSYKNLAEEFYNKIVVIRSEINTITDNIVIDYNKVKEARIWTEGCDDDVVNIGGTHSAVTSAHIAKAFATAPHGMSVTANLKRMGAMINAVSAWGLIEGNIDSQVDLYDRLTYSNNREVPADVGQLKAGTTFINEPIKDILEKILYGEQV